MKTITLLMASFMLATFATNASVINDARNTMNFGSRFDKNEPIAFNERGIQFFVFADGQFDFNTRPESANSGGYFYKGAGTRGNDNQELENFGVRIEQDNFGRIRRVGNTFINYDFQDRVARIGSVFIKYNRFALCQVGGFQLVYNRFGDLIDTFGSVKNTRYNGFANGNQYYGNNYNNENLQQNNNYNQNESYFYRNDGTKVKDNDENREKEKSEPKSDRR
jgi:hypothetical protein